MIGPLPDAGGLEQFVGELAAGRGVDLTRDVDVNVVAFGTARDPQRRCVPCDAPHRAPSPSPVSSPSRGVGPHSMASYRAQRPTGSLRPVRHGEPSDATSAWWVARRAR